MYVYTDIKTQILVCIQIYYHSSKSYLNTNISLIINKYKYSYNCMKRCFVYILIICNVKVNVSPLKSTSSLLSSSK